MERPLKILVKYATRGRPERFFDGMNTIYDLCSQPEYLRVLITADTDDPTMFNDEVRDRIGGYKNAMVIYGKSEGKIHATNRDFDLIPNEWKDWDVVCNFSDDQRWTILGWDDCIRGDFKMFSPELSHFMAYLDVDTKGVLSTLYIAGRNFFNLFGFVYDEAFKSLFADNLVEDVARYLGKYHYTGYTIYQHLLPSYGHLPEDAMFREQQDLGWSVDMNTYNEIIKNGIPEYLKQFNL